MKLREDRGLWVQSFPPALCAAGPAGQTRCDTVVPLICIGLAQGCLFGLGGGVLQRGGVGAESSPHLH